MVRKMARMAGRSMLFISSKLAIASMRMRVFSLTLSFLKEMMRTSSSASCMTLLTLRLLSPNAEYTMVHMAGRMASNTTANNVLLTDLNRNMAIRPVRGKAPGPARSGVHQSG